MNVYRRDAGLLCFVLNDGSRDTFAGRLLPNRGLVNRCADRRRHRPLQSLPCQSRPGILLPLQGSPEAKKFRELFFWLIVITS